MTAERERERERENEREQTDEREGRLCGDRQQEHVRDFLIMKSTAVRAAEQKPR